VSPASRQKAPLAQTTLPAFNLKQSPVPAFTFLYFIPQAAGACPRAHKQQAARMAIAPLLEVTCIRLI
jgi:hypothetical protein